MAKWIGVVIAISISCAAPSPAPTAQVAPPTVAPSATQAKQSAAIEKADRLIAEMRAREAAQAGQAVHATDEATWKRRMHTLQTRFMENIERANGAVRDADSARQRKDLDAVDRSIVEAAHYQSQATQAMAAIEQLRDEGRRANIPDGWLRWPQ